MTSHNLFSEKDSAGDWRETSVKSRSRTSKRWTSLRAGFRVMTHLTLDVVPGLRASSADYGLTSPREFARFDQPSHSWKIRQVCLAGDLAEFLQTWPQAGMTRNGIAYRLRPLARRNYELASGFWPTPVGTETRRTAPYSQGGQSMSFVLGGMPNPRWLEWLMGLPDGWPDGG